MLDITDSDRANCSFFKSAKEFENGLGAKYRKPIILLSIFSLIYNVAGMEISGSGLGIISGKITNPSVIGYALFLSLLYNLIVYLSDLRVRYEDYYLSVTDKGNQNRFEQSLITYLVENRIKNLLKDNNIDVDRVQFHNYDNSKNAHKFEIHGVEKYQGDQISKALNEIDASPYTDKILTSEFVYTFPYQLTEDDINYFTKHFKYLKLLHFRIFIEYRIPYILAIVAIFSFLLRT